MIEYKFADKLETLGKPFEHRGLSPPITPLEGLLVILPAEPACGFREALTKTPTARR